MMRSPRRLLALLLCLCLLPVAALGDENSPVYRSDFTLQVGLRADGFPAGTKTDYQAWQDFLDKLSLRGVVDTQDFTQRLCRIYFDGGLYLNGQNRLPFTYDAYSNFRYVRSPALDGASVHFQMYNFLEFMQKPREYFELPTHYLSLLLYPEATTELAAAYYDPLIAALGGIGTRTIPYEMLLTLAEKLNDVALYDDDSFYRLDNYLRALLWDVDANDATLEALGSLENWLAFLDPSEEGLSVTVNGSSESWVLGGHELFQKTTDEGGTRFTLTLPNAEGYTLSFAWTETNKAVGRDLDIRLAVTLESEERVTLGLALAGLPKDGETDAAGTAVVTYGGSALADEGSQRFDFRYGRDANELPFAMSLNVEWINPQTDKPALTVAYKANMTQQKSSVLVERTNNNRDDFFHLNESYIEEYKERFLPTLALAAVPFLLEVPAPVINDVMNYLIDSGMLMTLGIE